MLMYNLLFLFNIITIPVEKYSKRTYFYVNSFFIWFLMAFKGYTVGSDTYTYISLYRSASTMEIPTNFSNWFFPANGARFENGYLVLNKFLAIINSNPQFLFIVSSTIFILCLIFMVNELHLNPIVSILVFECLGFFSFFMSGLRQGLACSFCMVAFVFAVKKKPIFFLLFCYFAISMHVSAAIFIIVYLFNYLGNNWKTNGLVFLALLVALLTFDDIFAKIAIFNKEMSNFVSSSANSGGFLNVILSVSLIVITLVAVQYIELPKERLRLYTFSKYMLYIAATFYLISLQSTQLSRITLYFEIGYFPLLSNLFEFTNSRIRTVSRLVIIIVLLIYIWVILTFRPEWTGVVPYSFCFNQY